MHCLLRTIRSQMGVAPDTVKSVTHYVEITLCCITLVFHLTLILLILTTRSRVLHGYKYLLLLFSVCELGFSITHMLSEPILLVIHNDVVFFGYGIVGAHPSGPALLILWINFLSQIVICLTLHFVYRYVIVVKTRFSFLFQEWKFLIPLMVLYMGFAGSLAVVPILYSTADEELVMRISDRLQSMGLTPEEISIIGAPISYVTETGRSYNTFFLTLVVLALSINVFAIFTILYCGLGLHSYLKDAVLSEKTRRQQHQLFRALLVQTAVPLICIFIPATVFALGSVMELDLGVGYFPIFTLFVIFPVLDPLVIAYFITDYRHAILSIVSRINGLAEYAHHRSMTPLHEEQLENGYDEKEYHL